MRHPIKGFSSYTIDKNGNVYNKHNYKLSTKEDKDGYTLVCLKKDSNGKYSDARVHRLLAQTFIPNTHGKPLVNHKNGIKNDNRLENLEWVTHSENTQHSFDNGFQLSPNRKSLKVLQRGEVVGVFNSFNELANVVGIDRNTITKCVKNNELLLGEFELTVTSNDYRNHNKYNKVFFKVPNNLNITYINPLKLGDKLYPNLKTCSEDTGFSIGQLQWAIKKNNNVLGYHIEKVTKYDYIQYVINNELKSS